MSESNFIADQKAYLQLREIDIQSLKSVGLSAYPHKFNPQHFDEDIESESDESVIFSFSEFIGTYSYLQKEESNKVSPVGLIGRVYLVRRASKKLIFIDIHEEGKKIQVMLNAQFYVNAKQYDVISSVIRVGDVIGVFGFPTRTKTGELSIVPLSIEMLSVCKALLPPRTFIDESGNEVSGLTNHEVRHRQRYLDFIINENNMKTFKKRAKIIRELRNYLENDLELIEVDTPVLNFNVGGAIAKPFSTHSNDHDCSMFMRIAPELRLKELIIGGFKGVYELGKQFRNESNDHTHNSEFTSLEFYIQNHDYYDLMKICEDMLSNIVFKVNGSHIVKFNNKEIDFTPPFKVLDMCTTLEEKAGIVLPVDLSTVEAQIFLDETCTRLGIDCSNRTTAKLLDKLVGHFVEPLCINPTFIVRHPQVMSPLAKWDREASGKTERFELFINGTEYANAYTELNDPNVQLEMFKAQAKDKAIDDEAMSLDADFVRALEYGLPPTGGFGLGVDRFVMLLTNNTSIREVILFPNIKPLNQNQ